MDTIEQLAQEIIDHVNRGELDKAIVVRTFRDIVAGEFNPPSWWRSPEEQLAKACQLWPNAVLPEPPREFVPRTRSEVLLLHVPDTTDRYLRLIAEANEGIFEAEEGVTNNLAIHGQLAPNKVEFTQPVWLAFDPEYGRGLLQMIIRKTSYATTKK